MAGLGLNPKLSVKSIEGTDDVLPCRALAAPPQAIIRGFATPEWAEHTRADDTARLSPSHCPPGREGGAQSFT